MNRKLTCRNTWTNSSKRSRPKVPENEEEFQIKA
jgi:hypothetical protein